MFDPVTLFIVWAMFTVLWFMEHPGVAVMTIFAIALVLFLVKKAVDYTEVH